VRGNRRAVRLQPGIPPHPERRARRECQQVRQKVPDLVHQVDHDRPIRQADVDVEAENQERPRELLQFLDDVVVTNAGRDDLIFPARKRMSARSGHGKTDPLGRIRQLPAIAEDLLAKLGHVAADLRAHFDDRLMHLALDLVSQHRCTRRQKLGDVRPQLSALRVDDLEFLLDAEGEAVHEGMILQSTVFGRQSSITVHSPSPQSESAVPVGSPSRQSQSQSTVPALSRQSCATAWHSRCSSRRETWPNGCRS
jgi:hypothetical protein